MCRSTLLDLEIIKQTLLNVYAKFSDAYYFSEFKEMQYLLLKYMDMTNYLRRDIFTSDCETFISLD